MEIIVCIKQINDPEISPKSFKVDSVNNRMLYTADALPVISTFDEYAVEAALRLKERQGGKIIILSLGEDMKRDVVKKPLAMGADELILIEDPAFPGGDSWSTAYALATAIKKIGKYDLIFCGRQSADWDSGQVGIGIAEILGLPFVTIARKIEVNGGKALIERVITDGYELIEMVLPGVITVSNEHPAPRYPDVRGIMRAGNNQPVIWKPSDLDLDNSCIGQQAKRVKLVRLFQPDKTTICNMIYGDTPEDAAINLADRLRDDKII